MASETRERILVAALELFSHRGYASVGTRAIADAAGVNEVTIFRKFGSKEALWLEVFRRYVVRPDPELLLAGATGEPAHDLACAARAIVQLLRSNIKLLRMNMKGDDHDYEIEQELATHVGRTVAALETHLRATGARTTMPPDTVARTLVESLFGVTIHFEGQGRAGGREALDRWLEDFLPLFLGGSLASVPADRP
jgi:AcrR family transcriptional regulator